MTLKLTRQEKDEPTYVLWRIDPLLSGDSVYNDRFWTMAR
jgi:hypothetical protein